MENNSYDNINDDASSKLLNSTFTSSIVMTSINSKNKFDFIIEKITKNYNVKRNILSITFKKNLRSLLIKLNYKKHTDLNPLNYDIMFSILIDSDYPQVIPIVKTLTNFCFLRTSKIFPTINLL